MSSISTRAAWKALLNRWLKRFPALVFLGVASYLFLRSYVYRAPTLVDVASLNLRTLDGDPIPASAMKGRAVVLSFWAPWCGPCRLEIPWLERLQRDHPDVAVIGLENDLDSVEQARELARTSKISYMLALQNSETQRTFGSVPGVPTTLYISASGRVVHTATGIVPESVMRSYLKQTLAAR